MINLSWFKTDQGEILITYDSANGNMEQQKKNFAAAAAEAEIRQNVILVTNEEGRRRIDKAKNELFTQGLIEAIADHNNKQMDIAKIYAIAIAYNNTGTDWTKVNGAIARRWPSKTGLTRVKEMAWKVLRKWQPE